MVSVRLYEDAPDGALKYAVIAARYQGSWIFCRHKNRDTYEIPGGHREPGEDIEETAKRELYEESGALDYTLSRICAYSVVNPTDESETFGMLYFAEVTRLGPLPAFEITEISLSDDLPHALTYPEIQPVLWRRVRETVCPLQAEDD